MTEYVCGGCNRRNVKLWREGNVRNVKLKCAECLGALDVDKNGQVLTKTGTRTEKIGTWFPAVPVKGDDDGYWGYLSIPEEDFKWWRSLSN